MFATWVHKTHLLALISFTGNHGVIRNGLTSPWIPDGWSWGGVVSSHCPIWVEYYTDDKMEQSNPKSLDDITLDLPNSSG